MNLRQDTRYQDTPVYLFFEKYVLDVIGKLPKDKNEILNQIDLQTTFSTKSYAWKDVIREVLQLSPTIDVAILNQWYIQLDKSEAQENHLNADDFSRHFVDRYFEENSTVDVWTVKTLNEAKEFIYEHQVLLNA